MSEPDLNIQLHTSDVFLLFKEQLARDFEYCGLSAGFAIDLPTDFIKIRDILVSETAPHFSKPGSLMQILYRIDISEAQLKKYANENPSLGFAELVAELIIKRELQKVILKKKFSS